MTKNDLIDGQNEVRVVKLGAQTAVIKLSDVARWV